MALYFLPTYGSMKVKYKEWKEDGRQEINKQRKRPAGRRVVSRIEDNRKQDSRQKVRGRRAAGRRTIGRRTAGSKRRIGGQHAIGYRQEDSRQITADNFSLSLFLCFLLIYIRSRLSMIATYTCGSHRSVY